VKHLSLRIIRSGSETWFEVLFQAARFFEICRADSSLVFRKTALSAVQLATKRCAFMLVKFGDSCRSAPYAPRAHAAPLTPHSSPISPPLLLAAYEVPQNRVRRRAVEVAGGPRPVCLFIHRQAPVITIVVGRGLNFLRAPKERNRRRKVSRLNVELSQIGIRILAARLQSLGFSKLLFRFARFL
jgi:hypothetical protein